VAVAERYVIEFKTKGPEFAELATVQAPLMVPTRMGLRKVQYRIKRADAGGALLFVALILLPLHRQLAIPTE
jgi:hypothetical protein